MTTKKISDGVGKKIVEALKKQSAQVNEEMLIESVMQETELNEIAQEDFQNIPKKEVEQEIEPTLQEQEENEDELNNAFDFNSAISQKMSESPLDTGFLNNVSFASVETSVPKPSYNESEIKIDNVKILSNLINQLPPGISKQTGAQIIKQTMEALGISMKTVLNEAQQIQEKISLSSNECLGTIQECKKQIQLMEKQVQQYHKQYNTLNELISLFVQTGI